MLEGWATKHRIGGHTDSCLIHSTKTKLTFLADGQTNHRPPTLRCCNSTQKVKNTQPCDFEGQPAAKMKEGKGNPHEVAKKQLGRGLWPGISGNISGLARWVSNYRRIGQRRNKQVISITSIMTVYRHTIRKIIGWIGQWWYRRCKRPSSHPCSNGYHRSW